MVRNLILIIPLLLVCACATTPDEPLEKEYSRVFNAPFEVVWRATQQALLNYPMNINNMDTGYLQTLFITGKHRYKAPHKESEILPSGYQYRLNVYIEKGESRTKVLINKEVRLQKDFFLEPVPQPSDGFEEKMVLYRIKREIAIEQLLKKVMPPVNAKSHRALTPLAYSLY
jgi:hypothetical protein